MPWSSNPAILNLIPSELAQTSAQPDDATNEMWTNYFHRMRTGKDVSGTEVFQPTIQAGQTHQAQLAENATQGAQGLVGSQGSPEQQALAARTAQIGQERAKEQTGEAVAQEVAPLAAEGSAFGAQQAAMTDMFNLNKLDEAGNAINQGSQFYTSPWLGLAQGLLSGGASAAASFI